MRNEHVQTINIGGESGSLLNTHKEFLKIQKSFVWMKYSPNVAGAFFLFRGHFCCCFKNSALRASFQFLCHVLGRKHLKEKNIVKFSYHLSFALLGHRFLSRRISPCFRIHGGYPEPDGQTKDKQTNIQKLLFLI